MRELNKFDQTVGNQNTDPQNSQMFANLIGESLLSEDEEDDSFDDLNGEY